MTKIRVQSSHKCGTCFQEAFFRHLAKNSGLKFFSSSASQHPKLKYEEKFIYWSRNLNERFSIESEQGLKYIGIIRHPFNQLLSRYYSFGWTHNLTNKDHRAQKERKAIQKLSPEEFLLAFLSEDVSTGAFRELAPEELKNWNRDVLKESSPYVPFTYEMMISNFKSFCKKLGEELAMESQLQFMYKEFKHVFAKEIKDKSEDIVKKGLKTHRRTTDIFEYKKKFEKRTLDKLYDLCPEARDIEDLIEKQLA